MDPSPWILAVWQSVKHVKYVKLDTGINYSTDSTSTTGSTSVFHSTPTRISHGHGMSVCHGFIFFRIAPTWTQLPASATWSVVAQKALNMLAGVTWPLVYISTPLASAEAWEKIVNNLEITFILLFYYILVFVTQIFSQWDVQYSGVSSPHLDGIVQLSTVMAHDSKWPMTTGYIFFGTTISFMYNLLSFSAEFTFEQKVFYRLHGIFCYQMIWFFRT